MERRRIIPRTDTQIEAPSHDIGPAGFTARAGDVLVVHYTGAKLQIAPYTTVEVDSATYTRTLEEGDDPAVEFDRVYAFVRDQTIKRAKAKLNTFADELAKAKKRAAGEG